MSLNRRPSLIPLIPRPAFTLPLFFFLATYSALAPAQPADTTGKNALKTINNAGGGQVVYGPLVQQPSLPVAMGVMLRTIHSQFGNRPEIGRFFQAKGSSSAATFFTVTATTLGNKPLAGLVIVSMPPGAAPSAAILYDDASHFGTSLCPMMTQLNAVWHPEGSPSTPASPAKKGAPTSSSLPALHQTSLPDGSASIGLPAGWRITGGGHAQLHAQGPEGQQINFFSYSVEDPRTNPLYRPGVRPPGTIVVYPWGADLTEAFPTVAAQLNQKMGVPAPTYHFTNVKPYGDIGPRSCVFATGDVDRHDGNGLLAQSSIICAGRPLNGNWILAVYQTATPISRANIDGPLLATIETTYQTNDAVLNAQTQATIAHIHEIGDVARRQADAAHAANDAHNASVEANWDSRDKHSQDFSNYLLDQTVIQDSQRNERATVWNQYADTLVKADPNRYQYVPTKDFIKGIDY
jgi:hypothetical protein